MELVKEVLDNDILKINIGSEIDEESQSINGTIELDIENQNEFIEYINTFFIEKIQPQLEVVILNKKSKFPNLSDTSSFLTIKIETKDDKIKFALIKLPNQIDRFIVLSKSEKKYIILVDDIIRFHLDEIFEIFAPKKIVANMIKISRDAEL